TVTIFTNLRLPIGSYWTGIAAIRHILDVEGTNAAGSPFLVLVWSGVTSQTIKLALTFVEVRSNIYM
ncbi:hypothetical protein BDQ17DRAFT_1364918, partial [Cyathus striatus]